MSRRLTEVVTTTLLDHHMFELINDGFGEGLAPAGYGHGAWVTAGRSAILVVTPFDHPRAILRVEEWDGEPGPEPVDGRGPWQDDVVTVSMECFGEDGRVVLGQITAGQGTLDFTLSRLGVYHVRLARRNGEAEERARAAVRAAFDEDEWDGTAFRSAMDAIDVVEEYLVRFWPASTDDDAAGR